MTIQFVRQYRKRETGKLVFVYNIKGTPDEIKAYQASNPKHIVDSVTKEVLFFTVRFVGKTAEMLEGANKQWYPDTTELDQRANLEQNFSVSIANEVMGK